MWGHTLSKVLVSYGIRCQESIVNVRLPTRIVGMPTAVFFPHNDIKLWAREQAKPATLNDSIAPCVSVCLG